METVWRFLKKLKTKLPCDPAIPWLDLYHKKAIIQKDLNFQASLVAQMVKNLPAMWETRVRSLGWEDSPGGGHGNPLQYSCLENPHGQRSLVGDSPWSWKESDMTEQLRTAQQNICIGYFSGQTRWLLKVPSQLELEFPFCIFHKRWSKILHWIFNTKYHALDSVLLTDYINSHA